MLGEYGTFEHMDSSPLESDVVYGKNFLGLSETQNKMYMRLVY